jgi:poly [ADP-ribose] polymerase
MLIRNTSIADIDCLISCGEVDNENAEVRKARSLSPSLPLSHLSIFFNCNVKAFLLIATIKDSNSMIYVYPFVYRRLKIPIVREDYIGECIRKNRMLPFDLYKVENTLESKGGTVTVKVKGRSAVHESSGLQDTAHILEDGKSIYNTTLNMSDLARGVNRQGHFFSFAIFSFGIQNSLLDG